MLHSGLYSESHGIVGNDMYDPVTDEAFHLSLVGRPGDNTNNSLWWDQHVPLWATATAAGSVTNHVSLRRRRGKEQHKSSVALQTRGIYCSTL